MNALIGSFSFLIVYVYLLIPLAPVIYIFLKWRSYRDNSPPDPQLGMKVMLYYFKTLAYHACLASLAAIFSGILTSENDLIEIGLGLFISGGIIYVVQYILVQKLSNAREFPLTARVYMSFNLVIVGLVGMVSFMYTITTLISKGFRTIRVPLVIFIVYGIAWACQTFLFCKPSKK